MIETSKYMKAYQNICLKAYISKREKNKDNYYERHHIQPKSLGGIDIETNLCLLTGREHYIVHFLLYKHFKSIGDVNSMNKMAYAWNMMSMNSSGKRYISKTFELARLAMIEVKKKPLTKQHKHNISKALKGHKGFFFGINSSSWKEGHIPWNKDIKISEEHCDNISNALKGRKLSEEHKIKLSNVRKGKKQKIVKCPHCDKHGGEYTMPRWHFDNCKLK